MQKHYMATMRYPDTLWNNLYVSQQIPLPSCSSHTYKYIAQNASARVYARKWRKKNGIRYGRKNQAEARMRIQAPSSKKLFM